MKKFAILCVALASLAVIPMVQAGRFPGPGSDKARCEAFGSVTYYEKFYGGETASVSIVGDGYTDLDLFVYDLQGRLVAQGIGPTDIETVSWFVPGNTPQTYKIVVRNLGSTYNVFGMGTN
jgi:hypothetical protein